MTHLFVVNPKAGKRTNSDEICNIISAKMQGKDFIIRRTEYPGHGTEIVRETATSGEWRVYACGGDGTLNEVANGAAGLGNVAITQYPCGTGNDFLRIFSETPKFLDIEALSEGEERDFDIIKAGAKYSLNICSVGFDARVARDVHKFSKFPLVTPFGAFTISVFYNLFKGVSDNYKISVDGKNLDGKYSLICISNARYYGGGYMPMGDANPMDGIMDVLLIKGVSRFAVPGLISKYKSGRYLELGDIAVRLAAKELSVNFLNKNGVINTDGEMYPIPANTDTTIELSKSKIRFFGPVGCFDVLDKQIIANVK